MKQRKEVSCMNIKETMRCQRIDDYGFDQDEAVPSTRPASSGRRTTTRATRRKATRKAKRAQIRAAGIVSQSLKRRKNEDMANNSHDETAKAKRIIKTAGKVAGKK